MYFCLNLCCSLQIYLSNGLKYRNIVLCKWKKVRIGCKYTGKSLPCKLLNLILFYWSSWPSTFEKGGKRIESSICPVYFILKRSLWNTVNAKEKRILTSIAGENEAILLSIAWAILFRRAFSSEPSACANMTFFHFRIIRLKNIEISF